MFIIDRDSDGSLFRFTLELWYHLWRKVGTKTFTLWMWKEVLYKANFSKYWTAFQTNLLLLTSRSVPLLHKNFGLGAALGLHSIITRPPLAARIFFFIGFISKVGANAKKKELVIFPFFFAKKKKILLYYSTFYFLLINNQ